MDNKLFGPKRRQVDLGGTGSSHASATSLVQAREQRERRERSRQEGLAAVKIQSVFRGHCSRRYTRAANAQRYDLVILDCNSLIPATQLLLASDKNAARYAAWCRFVVSSKSIFTPFESGSPSQWLSLLKRIARQLLSLASELPNAPQSTLFLEVIRILVDSKKYPQKFAQYAQELTRFLITSGLYLQLRAHILAIVSVLSLER